MAQDSEVLDAALEVPEVAVDDVAGEAAEAREGMRASLERVEGRIAEAEEARGRLEADYRAKRARLDAALSELRGTRRELARALRVRGGAGGLSAERQAGRKNIDAVRLAARRLRRSSQAQLGERSGVGTGSLTWAIRALEESGEIRDTGERERGSRVFEYVPKARRGVVLRPGDDG